MHSLVSTGRSPDVFCGILNVDKPAGLTSHDVVATVRRWSGQRKVGHAGTLDPMATGVLLVCLGSATRMSEYLVASPKTYHAGIYLGVSTTTDDAEGEVIRRAEVRVTATEIGAALQQFVGHVSQVPPVYSAIKRRGKRLYQLARQGIPVEAPAREVDIYALCLVEWTPPLASVQVHCGPGTYVRALARDLGAVLGCGAHLAALRRTQSGRFTAKEAVPVARLREAFADGTVRELLYAPDAAVADLPALYLDAETARRLAMGQQVGAGEGERRTVTGDEDARARAYGPARQFVGVVFRDRETGLWQPEKVFTRPGDILSGERSDARIQ
jgi:tRNA pseudouridine55 synthase